VVHRLQRMHPGGKYIFQQIGSAGPHCQDHPAVVHGILDPGGLVAIVAVKKRCKLFVVWTPAYIPSRRSD
jgi:hypothetical protein